MPQLDLRMLLYSRIYSTWLSFLHLFRLKENSLTILISLNKATQKGLYTYDSVSFNNKFTKNNHI